MHVFSMEKIQVVGEIRSWKDFVIDESRDAKCLKAGKNLRCPKNRCKKLHFVLSYLEAIEATKNSFLMSSAENCSFF